ncbi:MAG: DUF58 domain-containing protein [Prevotellaceae bacterium]|jgi:hypothetical protein|nr:DUF58 domain-containing protein [Prevotellaceae bacterium]
MTTLRLFLKIKTAGNSFLNMAKYIRKWFPVHITFFILILFFILIEIFIDSDSSEKVRDISNVLVKIIISVIGVIILFSFTATLIPYILYKKSGRKPEVKFHYTPQNNVVCEIASDGLQYFFTGVIKAELTFDGKYTISFPLKKLKSGQAQGTKELELPDIKNYDLDTVTLFFQDVFRMFFLWKTFRYKTSVIIFPAENSRIAITSKPFALDDDKVRTDTIHHKEGELLHFKHFESSDDIRRIVWPVYAKTKELIIRTIEMQNMYASKIDLYASFCNGYHGALNRETSNAILNRYKSSVWTVYQSLKEENEVCFAPDQQPNITGEYQHEVSAQIAGMSWHTKQIEEYLKTGNLSVCCISSLIPAQDVKKILDTLDSNTFIVFISLKSFLWKLSFRGIIKSIFLIQKPEEKVSRKWLFSAMRIQILNNEKSIGKALAEGNIKYLEIK